jgi:ADP-heptose:LPS heptosyltransferase
MKILKKITFVSRFILKQHDFKQYLQYKSAIGKLRRKERLKKSAGEAIKLMLADADDAPIILVMGYGGFGDALQITPLIYALKHRFKHAKLIFAAEGKISTKLLESSPLLHKCLHVADAWELIVTSHLLRRKFDLIVEARCYVVKYMLGSNPRFFDEDIAFIRSAQETQLPWLKYTFKRSKHFDLLWLAAKEKGLNAYELMAHTSGFTDYDFEDLRVELPPNLNVMEKFNLPSSYLVVSNFAESLSARMNLWTKCLPPDKMQETLARLTELGITTVLIGTANDPGDYEVSYDLRGKTNMFEAAAIVQKASLVMGPEGGLVNLARAMGKRSVVFFGSTPPSLFAFKGNINIEPSECGGCWWTISSYLGQCPLLLKVPMCTNSIQPQRLVEAVQLGLRS